MKSRRIDTTLHQAKRLPSSANGNPRWEFHTEAGTFRTGTDFGCAYKGEPRVGPLSLLVDGRRVVVDYGWPGYPLTGPAQTWAGFVCKLCGGPSPVGVGYVSNDAGAREASEALTRCACGYSVHPDAWEVQGGDDS